MSEGTSPPQPSCMEKSLPVPQGSGTMATLSISIPACSISSIIHIVVPSPPPVMTGSRESKLIQELTFI